MQVSQESINEGSLVIEVKIEKSDFESKVNKELKAYQQKAAMPGFRPGKVPFGLIKKMAGGQIVADQVNKTVSEGLSKYLSDNKIKILGHPMADIQRTGTLDLENGDNFSFFFNVLLAPEFEVNIEEMEFDYPKVKISDQELEETITRIIAENPETAYPETVEDKDVVELKAAQANDDGQEVEGGYQANVALNLEEITNEQSKADLIGKELGSEFIFNFGKAFGDAEKTIRTLKLKEEENQLAESNFNVVLDEIRREVPATLNETLFSRLFPNDTFESEADFKEKIRNLISSQWDAQSDYYVYSIALKKLVEETPMKLDPEVLKQWLLDTGDENLKAEDLDQNFDEYLKSIRFQLIEEQLVEKYPELKVSRGDVRQYVSEFYLRQYGMADSPEMASLMESLTDSVLKDKKEADRIHNQISESKMVKLFREKLQLKEVEMSTEAFKDLMKTQQPQDEETNLETTNE